ncbi:MAG: SRPBCC family protein [Polyangiaceae bacterium]
MTITATEHLSEAPDLESRPMPQPRKAKDSVYECEPFGVEFFGLDGDSARAAPVRHQFVRELDVSAKELWRILEDPKSWPVWAAPGIAEVEWTTSKPYGVGTERTVFFIGGMEVYERFIAWTPESEMAFCFRGTTQRVWWRFGEHYSIRPLGDSRCELTWTVAYEPRHVFAKIHPIAGPIMRLSLKRYADGLVKYCRKHSK